MGSNGYIMHITYLNYVDISPAEPKKSIFRVCKTVKMTKIGKMTIFWSKYFSQKIGIFTIKIGFGHDPVRLLWAPMGHIHPNTRPYFQKVDNPSIWYGPVVRNFWPKKSTKKSSFLGVTVTKSCIFSRKMVGM